MARSVQDDEQFVYFIQAVESERVKIGSAFDPHKRLAILQTGSPERLELLGYIPGGRSLEVELHRELRSQRLHGEWFKFGNPTVLAIGKLLGWNRKTPQQIDALRKAEAARKAYEKLRDERLATETMAAS